MPHIYAETLFFTNATMPCPSFTVTEICVALENEVCSFVPSLVGDAGRFKKFNMQLLILEADFEKKWKCLAAFMT